MTPSPIQKSAVITGCSTGFGRVTTLRLLRHGWRVFATVRREEDAASLRAEAKREGCEETLRVLLCDITDGAQVTALREAVGAEVAGLYALVNNAGTAYAAPVELLELDDLRRQLEINVIAQVGMIQAFLPLLKTARGTIVNLSSISGRFAAPVIGAYAASKFALEALSDALRLELAPSGVRVVLIEPGSSATAIWGTSRERATKLDQHRDGPYGPLLAQVDRYIEHSEQHGFPPEEVARAIELALNSPRPKARYLVPKREGRMVLARKFLSDRLWDQQVRRVMKW